VGRTLLLAVTHRWERLGDRNLRALFMALAVENLQWNIDYQYYRYDRAARLPFLR
jgi:hypothetical protein